MPRKDLEARREYCREYAREWCRNNPEKRAAYAKGWRERYPEKQALKRRRQAYRRKYGIEIEVYERMFAEQNGVCAICGSSAAEGKWLAVDHNHATGQVRSLLCDGCNWKIGVMESPIRSALEEYLLRWGMPMMPGQSEPGGRPF